jgi:hypothetical protein
MKTLLRLLLKSQHQRNRSGPAQTEKGMTLVELLVGSIMAFLIITPMLTFVVDMLNTDRREQVKSNTEQDIQAAADFISQDLSQAIYIYDQAGITAIKDKLPNNGDPKRIPILVFWKRQLMKKAIPVDPSNVKPKDCDGDKCNDTYVLSLVAYYQIKETVSTSIWCQPSGDTCPTRIARYEIRDGVRKPDPIATDTNLPYYNVGDTTDTQQPDPAFNKKFDFSKPTVDVTMGSGFPNPEVLVNYIDHSPGPILTPCTTALGNPSITIGVTTTPVPEATLKITDNSTNSFYACVDTSNNIARVTIRGNSLRRLQADKADFISTSSAYFPITTVQVNGLGGLGK